MDHSRNKIIVKKMSAQIGEAGELSWEGATELIPDKVPEKSNCCQMQVDLRLTIKSIEEVVRMREYWSTLGIQSGELSEVEELRWDGSTELILGEGPKRAKI